MSTAFFPQVEGGSRGIASAVDGKALARSSDLLDELATRSGVSPLTSFMSVHNDDFGIFEEAGLPLPEPKWFSAREGLTTVAALRQACRAEGVSDHALKDLEALEKVLTQADEENRLRDNAIRSRATPDTETPVDVPRLVLSPVPSAATV
jgi:hypothetical protein